MQFSNIIKRIEQAIARFNKKIPASQRSMFDALMEEVHKLDTSGDTIKATVANIRRVAAIKNKLNRIILTDEYKAEVKEFAKAFNDITKLQNQYWKNVETKFKPRPLLKAIRQQSIADVVKNLTESGLDANVGEPIERILKSNITTGGSIKELTSQLRENLLTTDSSGTLERYTKTLTTTSINQYSATYTNTVSSDLGMQWYRYANTLIETSRPWCQSMREENQWFHVSMIPALIRAEDMYYTNEEGQRLKVPINNKTKLPNGFIEGTNASNFFINRGGWNCGHQIQPVSEGLVPKDVREKIMQRPDYIAWKRAQSA